MNKIFAVKLNSKDEQKNESVIRDDESTSLIPAGGLGSGLVLGTGNSDAYYGDRGEIAYLHSINTIDKNPHQSELEHLYDVDISGVTDGQSLVYNGSTKLWEATDLSIDTSSSVTIQVNQNLTDIIDIQNDISNFNLSDCVDVAKKSPSVNDVLTWSGTGWVPFPVSSGGRGDNSSSSVQVVQNSADIATNVTDISNNTANISTNATNIALNTNAINSFILSSCLDVSSNSPNTNDVLSWNGSEWVPIAMVTTTDGLNWIPDVSINVNTNTSNIATNSSDIANINSNLSSFVINNCKDVNTTTSAPTTDDTLTWDGTNWVPDSSINVDIAKNASNITLNATNIQTNAINFTNMVINDCNDVDTTSNLPNLNDVLMWNNLSGSWNPNSTLYTDVSTNKSNISSNTSRLDNFTLDDCTDTSVSSPSFNSLLNWNGISWVPDKTIRTSVTNNTININELTFRIDTLVINDCLDVDTISSVPTTGDVLSWDGYFWKPDVSINANISQNATNISTNTTNIASNAYALANISINDCVDVQTTEPTNGELLMYDDNDNKWKPDNTLINTVSTNTNNILLNFNAIEELRIKTGEQKEITTKEYVDDKIDSTLDDSKAYTDTKFVAQTGAPYIELSSSDTKRDWYYFLINPSGNYTRMIHIKATFYFENSRDHAPGFILQNADGTFVPFHADGNLIMTQPTTGNVATTLCVDQGYISSGNQCYLGDHNETRITSNAPVSWDIFISKGSSYNHLSGITLRAQAEWKTESGIAQGTYLTEIAEGGEVHLSNIRNIGFRNGDATYRMWGQLYIERYA